MLRRLALSACFLLACPVLVTAQGPLFPFIVDLTETSQGTAITIAGNRFGSSMPKVTLGTSELTVTERNQHYCHSAGGDCSRRIPGDGGEKTDPPDGDF
jgi:hypothetical protein